MLQLSKPNEETEIEFKLNDPLHMGQITKKSVMILTSLIKTALTAQNIIYN